MVPVRSFTEPEIHRAVDRVLSRREFRHRGPSIMERLMEWVGRWLDRLGLRFPSLHVGGKDVRLVQVVAVSLAVIGFLFVIYSLARIASRRLPEERLAAARADAVDRSAGELLREADAFAAAGDYRSALERAYLGTLLFLGERDSLEFRPARTNWENLRTLRPDFPAASARELRRVSRLFDRKWYGLERVTEEEYAGAEAGLAQVREEERASRSVPEAAA